MSMMQFVFYMYVYFFSIILEAFVSFSILTNCILLPVSVSDITIFKSIFTIL